MGQPRLYDASARRTRTPRMGPPPGGTTTALLQPTVARHEQGCHSGAGEGRIGSDPDKDYQPVSVVTTYEIAVADEAGKLRILPTSGDRRALPAMPTLKESAAHMAQR